MDFLTDIFLGLDLSGVSSHSLSGVGGCDLSGASGHNLNGIGGLDLSGVGRLSLGQKRMLYNV